MDSIKKTRVAIIKCMSYDRDEVFEAINKGLNLLGGISRFVKPGEKILLKPNLLIASNPDEGVCTHPSVFVAVAELFKNNGAEVSWGDSPAFGSLTSVAKKAGILEEAKRLKLEKADFTSGTSVSINNDKREKKYLIARAILDSDGVVSIPKMKTHGLMKITCAVKNQYGCLPGVQKGMYHAKFLSRSDFARMLVEINLCVKPRLYIVDGIDAMEAGGPRSGILKRMGIILIGTDPIALDTLFCRIINLNPVYAPTNIEGDRLGLGTMDTEKIEIVGEKLEEIIDNTFQIERKPLTEPVDSLAGRLVRKLLILKPRVDRRKCSKCGNCTEICPVEPKAIFFPGGEKSHPPALNYNRCIRCYCCFEICPEKAIYLSAPLRRGKNRI